MLLDPRTYGEGFAEDTPAYREPCRTPVTRYEPPHDFLTLPRVGTAVETKGRVHFQTERSLSELIAVQFSAGVLHARDVCTFSDAPQAMAVAFGAWLARQQKQWQALHFQFLLYGGGKGDCRVSGAWRRLRTERSAVFDRRVS
jgi:hypothetical protein